LRLSICAAQIVALNSICRVFAQRQSVMRLSSIVPAVETSSAIAFFLALCYNKIMLIKLIDEYNYGGHLVHVENLVGAYVRGATLPSALQKLPAEVASYCRWIDMPLPDSIETQVVQQKLSDLQICDADSDVIFLTESAPLTSQRYAQLKALALKSAQDFLALYTSVPQKNAAASPPRKTFYGNAPHTAAEMYEHTKNVNSYYFGEIGVDVSNAPNIYECRLRGFELLEKRPDLLQNAATEGSYGEFWSVAKVCRRFVWHDRIHAKAMWRLAQKLCGADAVVNPFFFE